MRIVIEIDTDNDAFQRCPEYEVRRILRGLLESEMRAFKPFLTEPFTTPVILRDTNGNTCGSFHIEEDR